jgi:predicted ribosome quality control (RQC) complex YloA/Tae2 family protein
MLRYAFMDISVFKAIISELSLSLPGKRLAELAEGQSGEFYLLFKGEGGKVTLLISPRPQSPRIHLISVKPKDLRELTPFGQSLANLLLGSRLLSIEQEGLERVALFNFSRKIGKN